MTLRPMHVLYRYFYPLGSGIVEFISWYGLVQSFRRVLVWAPCIGPRVVGSKRGPSESALKGHLRLSKPDNGLFRANFVGVFLSYNRGSQHLDKEYLAQTIVRTIISKQ